MATRLFGGPLGLVVAFGFAAGQENKYVLYAHGVCLREVVLDFGGVFLVGGARVDALWR